jgi:Ca2+-binding RTX toxin-like protein
MLKYSFMAFLMLSLAATGYGGAEGCEGDFLGDGDVDGSDLARLIMGLNQLNLGTFAQQFGESGCLDELVAFTFTTAAGQINTLPGAATSVRVTFNGETLTSASSPMTFGAPAGDYTFTAVALNGGATVATMGPIDLSVVEGFSITTPLAFTAFPAFDTYHTDVGLDTPNTLIYFGAANRDRIVQYGGAANDLLSVDTGAENDWIEQYGGGGVDTMVADTGTGNDYIYQQAGAGGSNLTATAGKGDDWIIQIGGNGNDNLNGAAGDGNDYIIQEGGAGNDTITVTPGYGNDTVIIDAGPGDDTITYNLEALDNADTVTIDGGTGTDTLTVKNPNGLPLLIQYSNLNVIYGVGGGTTFTVTGIEQITVTGAGGATVFTWP